MTEPVVQYGRAPGDAAPITNLWRKQIVLIAILLSPQVVCYFGFRSDASIAKKQAPPPKLQLPARIGPWSGTPQKVISAVIGILKPDAIVEDRYVLTKSGLPLDRAPQVDVINIYSHFRQTFHSPIICLSSQGWVVGEEETKTIKTAGRPLSVTVMTATRGDQKTCEAYFFADSYQNASGLIPAFARMITARVMHRSSGAYKVMFAFDGRLLQANDDFVPDLSRLVAAVAQSLPREGVQNEDRH